MLKPQMPHVPKLKFAFQSADITPNLLLAAGKPDYKSKPLIILSTSETPLVIVNKNDKIEQAI